MPGTMIALKLKRWERQFCILKDWSDGKDLPKPMKQYGIKKWRCILYCKEDNGKGHLSHHVDQQKLLKLRDAWATFIYSFVQQILVVGLDGPGML